MSMGQFTFLIDEDLRRAAKVYAAERGVTLSDLIRDMLARKIGWRQAMSEDVDEASARRVMEAYSVGLIERSDALRRLGRDPSEVLWFRDRLNASGLPWPVQDREEAEKQADGLLEAMESDEDE